MATVHVTRRRKRLRLIPGNRPAPRRQRIWRRWLLGAVTAGAAIIWMLPMIAAWPPLLNRVAAMVLKPYGVHAHIAGASLGWFSPVVIREIDARDADQEPLGTVRELRIEKPLWSILLHPLELGKLQVTQPVINVVLEGGTSNLERMLSSYEGGSPESTEEIESSSAAQRALAATVVVDDGSLRIEDRGAKRRWNITGMAAEIVLASASGAPLKFSASGNVDDGGRPGKFTCNGEVSPAGEAQTGNQGTFVLDSKSLPLSLAGAIARRMEPETELSGRLTTAIRCRWSLPGDGQPTADIQGDLVAEQFELAGPWLSDDRLRLSRIHVPCRVARRGQHVEIGRLELDCDLAQVGYEGGLTLSSDWRQALLNETYRLTGQVDLARLAAALPATIHVRDETHITAGRIDFELSRARADEQFVSRGRIDASRLAAEHNGQPIVWEQPLKLVFAARDTPEGFALDELRCHADFLDMQAGGTLEHLVVQGGFDLKRLSDELGRFVDLDPLKMAGQGSFQLNVRRGNQGEFETDGLLDVAGLTIETDAKESWIEDRLTVRHTMAGQTADWRWQRIGRGQLSISAGGDRLTAQLREAVDLSHSETRWPLSVELRGRLDRWRTRLLPFSAALTDWDIGGDGDLTAKFDYATSEIVLHEAQCNVRDLHLWGGGLFVDEPALKLSAGGRVASDGRRIEVDQLQLETTTLALDSKRFSVAWSDSTSNGPHAEGVINGRGDVNRFLRWFHDPTQRAESQYQGSFDGRLRLVQNNGQTEAEAEIAIDRFVAAWSADSAWRQPRLALSAKINYDSDQDRIQLRQGRVVSAALDATASGMVSDVSGRRMLELDGEVAYRLDQLEGLIRTLAGSGVRVAGSGRQTFSVRGSLATAEAPVPTDDRLAASGEPPSVLEQLEARAAVDWQAADIYGFRVGPGELRAQLDRGMLMIEPLDLVVSQGRLRAAPRIRLAPGPTMLSLAPGQLIERVQLTPDMCAAGLQYVAPVLAGVARAEGQFSLAISDCRIPLSDPGSGDLAGQLTIHDVEVGPGPLVRELAVLLDRPGNVRLSRESVVGFRMVRGRVYHEGLELVFPDATVRTYGSVGLDHTLALMVEMPVPRKWIGNNPLGDTLRNQTIRVPVSGTLERPKVDQREVERLASRFIQQAAGNALEQQINRGLNRLFGPPK